MRKWIELKIPLGEKFDQFIKYRFLTGNKIKYEFKSSIYPTITLKYEEEDQHHIDYIKKRFAEG